jgi:hypothetical protein
VLSAALAGFILERVGVSPIGTSVMVFSLARSLDLERFGFF